MRSRRPLGGGGNAHQIRRIAIALERPRVHGLATALDDGAERNQAWKELQAILREEMPVIFLIEIGYTNIWNKRVHGLLTNGISMYSGWDGVWVE